MKISFLKFFDLDSAGFNNLPLFLSNINSKLESIANSYFNTNITRQLISGWHAAQLSDFGFKVDKQTQTDSKLQYKRLEKLMALLFIILKLNFLDGVVNLKD